MKATVDSGGRILLPKALRDALGIVPGSTVDLTAYGAGIQIIPGGRTAQLGRTMNGRLVARASTPVSDDTLFALIEAGRR